MLSPAGLFLQTELLNDPLGIGYATMTDAQIVASLNATTIAVLGSVPMSQVLIWAAPSVLGLVNAGQTQATAISGVPAEMVQSICQAAIKMLNMSEPLDLTNPAINGGSGMLQVLVAIGFVTPTQLAALLALGTTYTSRALSLTGWGVHVQILDVQAARGS